MLKAMLRQGDITDPVSNGVGNAHVYSEEGHIVNHVANVNADSPEGHVWDREATLSSHRPWFCQCRADLEQTMLASRRCTRCLLWLY